MCHRSPITWKLYPPTLTSIPLTPTYIYFPFPSLQQVYLHECIQHEFTLFGILTANIGSTKGISSIWEGGKWVLLWKYVLCVYSKSPSSEEFNEWCISMGSNRLSGTTFCIHFFLMTSHWPLTTQYTAWHQTNHFSCWYCNYMEFTYIYIYIYIYINQVCRDLWFSQHCCWRQKLSGMWHCAAQQVVPNIVNALQYVKTEGTTSPTTKWQFPEELRFHAQSCGNRSVVISSSLVTLCLLHC
jgi:hypothetical protein